MHPIWRALWDGRVEWPFVERETMNDSENVIINSPFQTEERGMLPHHLLAVFAPPSLAVGGKTDIPF